MKKTILKSLLFTIVGLFALSTVNAAEERVVATVDGIPILESQVRSVMGKKGDYTGALNKIIDDILVQKAIGESNVKIDPAQIDLIIENIAAQNGLTYGQFLDQLDYEGISLADYAQRIANQMLMDNVRNQAISNSVSVTREEVEALGKKMLSNAKATGSARKVKGKQYEVRHILLKLNPMLNDAQAKAQLERIRADIQSGKMTFAEAALKYSKDYLSGANGGSLGYAFPETYVGPFAQTVTTIKPGVISAPFRSEFGWHILEVTGTREQDRTEDAYRQKAYEQLVNSQLQEATKDWVKALRKTADIRYFNK